MGAWVTVDAAAAFVGTANDDPRLIEALEAAEAFCQRKRRDLDPSIPPSDDVAYAVKLWLKIVFDSRSALAQSTEYSEYANGADPATLSLFWQMIGAPRPVVG